jgi:iron complex outermembrane recepter protein
VRAAVAAILGTATVSGSLFIPAHAADAPGPAAPAAQPANLEEVVVTGSHIQRRDFEATSPVVTVSSDILQNTNTIAIETNLQKLPQFVPGVSQFVTQDVQNTATNTVGASTVNLRGLGANRNLVLVDGKRATPVNALMVVDINSIPSGAIQRVEVLTGGASATYGADAEAGVVNFILKRDFNGVDLDVQDGLTQKGDDQELRIAGLIGANFADGRGNAMFNVQFSKRGAALQRDREFFKKGWSDPTVDGTEFWFSNSQFAPDFATFNVPSQAAVSSIFTKAAPGSVTGFDTFFLNTDGTLFTGGQQFAAGNANGAYRYNGPLDGQYRSTTANGLLKQNQVNNLVSIPLTNYNLFGRAHYDLGHDTEIYFQGNYSTTHAESILQYSPAAFGWGVQIPVDAAHPVSPELATLLSSRANPTAPWNLTYILNFAGPRGTIDDNNTFQVMAGMDGKLPIKDWTWDAYVSHGNTQSTSEGTGFASYARWRAIVTAPNYGKGASVSGPNLGDQPLTCTSGIPVFGDFPVSQDCINAITANTFDITRMNQNVVEATVQGGLFDLPAGDLRFAAGADWRENTLTFDIDPLKSTTSTTDTIIGVFPAGSTAGEVAVVEQYAELLVPVAKGLPGLRKVDLDLGYRNSNYKFSGRVGTWMANLNWSVTDALRIRGGYQVASRAPNIGELFAPDSVIVSGTNYGDPCQPNTLAPYGANPATNPSGAAHALATCKALMGTVGANAYYNSPIPFGPSGPGIVLVTQVGSRAQTILPQGLKSETARTFTAGFVISSPFENAALKRFTASIDYYHINIDNYLNGLGYDTVYGTCLSQAGNPSGSITNPFCQLTVRNQVSGMAASTLTPFANLGQLKTSGVDFQLDWGSAFGDLGMSKLPGSVGLNVLATYLKNYDTQNGPGQPFVDSSGTQNTPNAGTFGAYFRYQLYTTASYYVGGATASLRWRHLPSVADSSAALNPATTRVGASSYDVLDLSSSWDINDHWQVRFGINNLLDTQPPITSSLPVSTPSAHATSGAGTTNSSVYDVLGRAFYVAAKLRF